MHSLVRQRSVLRPNSRKGCASQRGHTGNTIGNVIRCLPNQSVTETVTAGFSIVSNVGQQPRLYGYMLEVWGLRHCLERYFPSDHQQGLQYIGLVSPMPDLRPQLQQLGFKPVCTSIYTALAIELHETELRMTTPCFVPVLRTFTSAYALSLAV